MLGARGMRGGEGDESSRVQGVPGQFGGTILIDIASRNCVAPESWGCCVCHRNTQSKSAEIRSLTARTKKQTIPTLAAARGVRVLGEMAETIRRVARAFRAPLWATRLLQQNSYNIGMLSDKDYEFSNRQQFNFCPKSLFSGVVKISFAVGLMIAVLQPAMAACTRQDKQLLAALNRLRTYDESISRDPAPHPKLLGKDGSEVLSNHIQDYAENIIKIRTSKQVICRDIISRESIRRLGDNQAISLVIFLHRATENLCVENVYSENADAKLCSGMPGFVDVVQRWNFEFNKKTGLVVAMRYVAEAR